MSDRRSDIAEAVQRGADLQRALDEPLYQKAMAENARLRADLERMRAVVEAAAWAVLWVDEDPEIIKESFCVAEERLIEAVGALRNLRAGRTNG